MTLTVREQFLVKLYNVRPANADAIVVLCGEDAAPRIDVGAFLFQQARAPRIVVSGGVDKEPTHIGAERAYGLLLGKGIAHDRIIIEKESLNTKEQADHVEHLAFARGWKRLLIVASAYHAPRSYLTFVEMFDASGMVVIPVAANAPWNESPAGMTETRTELLARDIEKCTTYASDVASWPAGLKALEAL